MSVYKIVFQIPADEVDQDELLALRWQEGPDPHGPHIKVYPDTKDPETDQLCVQIRCKHRSLRAVNQLAEHVRQAIEEHGVD